jgi:small-conductance mechanosensitive channel
MPGDLLIAASWWDRNNDWVSAAITIVAAVVIAQIVDRLIAKRGRRMAAAVGAEELSPVATTRLRLVRRLLFALIVLLGVALALSQFEGIKRLATGVLASSAVLGLVIGFAARQTIANAVAGVLLAITQPIRLGDLVTFQEETGEVEDMRLTYTYIRLGDERRLVVPNELLASSPIENHTIVDPRVKARVDLWLPLDADVARAKQAIEREEGVEVSVEDVEKEGVRLTASKWAPSPTDRGSLTAELRLRSLTRLREEGLSSSPERP